MLQVVISSIFYPILALCSWADSLKQDMVFEFDFLGLLLFNIYAAEYLCCQTLRLSFQYYENCYFS